MTAQDQHILETFAGRLREVLPNAEVFAFGSRANGTAGPESDLDVCVVVSKLGHAERDAIRTVAWEIGFDSGVVIATVKYESRSFHQGADSASPLVKTIMAEGVAA